MVAGELRQFRQDVRDACLLDDCPAFNRDADGSENLTQVLDRLEAASLVLHALYEWSGAQFEP